MSEPATPAYGPEEFESRRRIPLAIRERVWGGEGLMGGLTPPRTAVQPMGAREALQASVMRLRATERARGRVYGGSDHDRGQDPGRTRRIPLQRLRRVTEA